MDHQGLRQKSSSAVKALFKGLVVALKGVVVVLLDLSSVIQIQGHVSAYHIVHYRGRLWHWSPQVLWLLGLFYLPLLLTGFEMNFEGMSAILLAADVADQCIGPLCYFDLRLLNNLLLFPAKLAPFDMSL